MTWKFDNNSVMSRAFQQAIALDSTLSGFGDNGGSRIYLGPCSVVNLKLMWCPMHIGNIVRLKTSTYMLEWGYKASSILCNNWQEYGWVSGKTSCRLYFYFLTSTFYYYILNVPYNSSYIVLVKKTTSIVLIYGTLTSILC